MNNYKRAYFNTTIFFKTFIHRIVNHYGYEINKTTTIKRFGDEYQALISLYCKELNFELRTETNDAFIFKEVFIDNCYNLPPSIAGQTVVDLGAHIGTFSLLALRHGAEKVIAVEPDMVGFQILKQHLSKFPNIVFYNNAIWKNNTDDIMLCGPSKKLPTHYRALETTSANLPPVCQKAKPITLAEIFLEQRLEKIDILKIDIEGGEIEVFSSLPQEYFAKINNIVGEWHGQEALCVLRQYLSPFYDLEFREDNPNVDYFFAHKKQ
ncbi:MAG: FkbM family methyltransferase [bacterium]|nr:FkbM family methyltransferase [bacterium]